MSIALNADMIVRKLPSSWANAASQCHAYIGTRIVNWTNTFLVFSIMPPLDDIQICENDSWGIVIAVNTVRKITTNNIIRRAKIQFH